MAEVNKSMTMGEILDIDMGIAEILLEAGMHCVGCPAHAMEPLEDGAAMHGINADELVAEINKYLASK
ncbi:MAG: DUF1858 domain-containing protein [Clostridiales bacterium]|nr:DUF1858 domain-containing protein [Clostridiales bacterium]